MPGVALASFGVYARRARFLAIFIVVATGALALASACTANVTEGCAAGQCDFGGGSSAATTTAAGTGGRRAAARAAGGRGGRDSGCMQTPQPIPSAGDIPCDVFAIIHAQCNRCHQGYDPTLEPHMSPTPLNGAPFPLLNYEETQY